MNYSNHNLRSNLQEWKNRLSRATYDQFGNQLKYLLENIEKNIQLKGVIDEACLKRPYANDVLTQFVDQRQDGGDIAFENETHQVAFNYQFLKYFISRIGNYNLHALIFFQRGDFNDTKSEIIENYISPIIYYLHDKLEKSSSTIYLLEKYKKRTEWFTKKELHNLYSTADKSYEQIFEDDLRLFLFDQGIDYPFSTPKSASGRADVVGEIETNDPIVIEIKIFDRNKNYGKDRVKDGFSQIVKYSNDFNKDVGYLVIFNMDEAELNLKFSEGTQIFPPSIKFNNKVFYFIVINLSMTESASKSGVVKEVEITEQELTAKG
ncbi:MAG TPA: hypothetical protein VL728_16415 [Cyclobacteriaceae bacterium]|jgi:hypothetical protein|nr:hypothetical protein [Cyclobacteriaceae bacterium]